jgi:hypothetical protein
MILAAMVGASLGAITMALMVIASDNKMERPP